MKLRSFKRFLASIAIYFVVEQFYNSDAVVVN